jgi:hypothetical protein
LKGCKCPKNFKQICAQRKITLQGEGSGGVYKFFDTNVKIVFRRFFYPRFFVLSRSENLFRSPKLAFCNDKMVLFELSIQDLFQAAAFWSGIKKVHSKYVLFNKI